MTSVSIATAAARGGAPKPAPPPAIAKEVYRKWVCIYPVYMNAERSLQDGRRVPKEACPKNPAAQDIAALASGLGLRVVFEFNKRHPRDFMTPGRVRVELKNAEGELAGPVKSRAHLMLTIALALKRKQEEVAAAAAASSPPAITASAAAPGSPQPSTTGATASPSSGGKGSNKKRK